MSLATPQIEAVLAKLFERRAGEVKVGLDRISQAYQELGEPGRAIQHALIAGTNGKGTTAAYLWHFLQQQQPRVGLYTSPHLRHFSERIQLSHAEVDDLMLVHYLDQIQQELPEAIFDSLSFFELTTLLAFVVFAAHDAQAYVLEVGLGGRWDATNISAPAAVAIVSIDWDHQEYLGDTLAKIASEKAAIMRPGIPAFLGRGVVAHQDATVLPVFVQRAAEVGCPLYCYGQDFYLQQQPHEELFFGNHAWKLPAAVLQWPSYQRENLLLAAVMASAMGVEPAAVQRGLQAVAALGKPLAPSLRARTERTSLLAEDGLAQEVILDVAHNPAGAHCLVSSLRELGLSLPLPGLLTFLRDKDINQMLDIFNGILSPVVLFRNKSDRSFSAGDLDKRHQHLEVCEDFVTARQRMQSLCVHQPTRPWVIAGSVVGLGDIFEHLSR